MVGCSLNNEVMDGRDKTPHLNFAIGITIAVSTSFVQSLGLTIQRKSHVINESVYPKEHRRSACRQPLWHLGFDTYVISNIIGSVFSIGYLPIVILAPLGAVTLIFNAFFAKILLGDVFTKQTIIGVFEYLKKKKIIFKSF
jgi:magnesium transporter